MTIAFDLTKSENAGNADWVIGTSPNWTGAYSDFGTALRTLGYTTQTLTGSSITASVLANVDVLVLPEPQDPFTTSERNAILSFVQNGGGLFLIADHDGSDRNNNGWDSRRVYNESLLTASTYGISFDANSIYADPTTLIENPQTQITSGITQAGMYAGCSITPSGNAVTRIWLRNLNEEGLVTNTYGLGRIAAYGDSSPFDDGTGNSGNDLHDGWHEYHNAQLGINVVQWLAQQVQSSVVFSTPILVPSIPVINQSVEIRINIQSTQAISFVYLYWKTTGGFNPVLMTLLNGTTYKAVIPAQTTPSIVQYYVLARTSGNLTGYYPTGAPASLASYNIGPTANEDETSSPELPYSIYPNPSKARRDEITFKSKAGTRIHIFNSKGEKLKSIISAQDMVTWDANDDNGRKCQSGIYIIRFVDGTSVISKKLILTD